MWEAVHLEDTVEVNQDELEDEAEGGQRAEGVTVLAWRS